MVDQAARAGYRIIDTATYYENFDGVAEALKGHDRRGFYIISKVWHDRQSPEDLRRDLDITLKQTSVGRIEVFPNILKVLQKLILGCVKVPASGSIFIT